MKIVSYFYISLPFMIFLIGWLKPYVAVPLAVGLIIALVLAVRDDAFQQECLQYRTLFIVLEIVCVWILLAGIGGYVWQTPDHRFRNTIFSELINSDWPVIGTAFIDGSIQHRGLCYYFGIWLPAALVGKVWGGSLEIISLFFGVCLVLRSSLSGYANI